MGPMIINNEIANISDPYTFWCDKNLNNKKLITSIIIAYLTLAKYNNDSHNYNTKQYV